MIHQYATADSAHQIVNNKKWIFISFGNIFAEAVNTYKMYLRALWFNYARYARQYIRAILQVI